MKRSTQLTSITDRLAALGELVRLRILRLLERAELSVGEVAKAVQLPQSTVSRHLKVLAEGGWVFKRTEGTATFYRLILDDLPAPARALWVAVRDQLTGSGESSAAELADDLRRLTSVLAERREDSQAFFGRVGGQWDQVRTELFGSRFTFQGLLTLLPRDWTVVDLGCGTGNAAELLAPVVKRVIAVDQSQPMLAAAKKRLADLSNIEFVKGDLSALPLPNACADAAVCFLVLHHIDEPAAALREAARVLAPGGRLLIVDMLEHDRTSYRHSMGHRWLGFSQIQIEKLCAQAGLKQPQFVPLPADAAAKGPSLFALTVFSAS